MARFPLYCLPYSVALLPQYPDSQLYLFVRQVWILYRSYFAAIGAWLGIQMLPVVLALACITCLLFLVYRKYFHGQAMRVPICFGPFLSLAALGTILMWP